MSTSDGERGTPGPLGGDPAAGAGPPARAAGAASAGWPPARAVSVALLVAAGAPATALLPEIALDGGAALAAWVVTETGGVRGVPFVTALAAALAAAARPLGVAPARAFAVALAALYLLVGVTAGGNEFLLKERLRVPRPFVRALAESGDLGGPPEDLYAVGDKAARRAVLRPIVEGLAAPALHPRVRAHWIEETGYSFPSGHAVASMTVGAFGVAAGLAWAAGPLRLALLALGPWALIVCATRVLLRVHSPLDVSVGALEGALLGGGAVLLVDRLLAGPLGAARTPPA